jgi:hypothetical protein
MCPASSASPNALSEVQRDKTFSRDTLFFSLITQNHCARDILISVSAATSLVKKKNFYSFPSFLPFLESLSFLPFNCGIWKLCAHTLQFTKKVHGWYYIVFFTLDRLDWSVNISSCAILHRRISLSVCVYYTSPFSHLQLCGTGINQGLRN